MVYFTVVLLGKECKFLLRMEDLMLTIAEPCRAALLSLVPPTLSREAM